MPRLTGFLTVILMSSLGISGVVEVPSSRRTSDLMAILYSGDGGWRTTDRGLARTLADQGIPVVGVNTLRYFWSRRTPQQAADDFSRLAEHYLEAWQKKRLMVAGYSYGANVLPFILSRTPESLRTRIDLLALLAPTRSVDFEFHLSQWFSRRTSSTAKPVLPEFQKLKHLNVLVFCGQQDGEALCKDLPSGSAKTVFLRGGHRFDRYYKMVAQDMLQQIQSSRVPTR